MQLSFLFWNLQRKPLAHRLARLAQHESLDFIALAENQIPDTELLAALKDATGVDFVRPRRYGTPDQVAAQTRKVHLFFRSGLVTATEQYATPTFRMVIYQIEPPGVPVFLLAVAHLFDPQNYSEDDRAELAIEENHYLRQTERDAQTVRTLVVGDLNMNPYERGMRSSRGFQAVMTRDIAERESRQSAHMESPFFYNPMWGHFGDRTPGSSGTIYYGSGVATPFWSIYDQVLLRPTLMHSLRELRILETDGQEPLVTEEGRPDTSSASDHLPLKFVLEL